MRVYLAYTQIRREGEDGQEVEKVFSTLDKAVDFIIKEVYNGPPYEKLGPTMLRDNAMNHILSFEVE